MVTTPSSSVSKASPIGSLAIQRLVPVVALATLAIAIAIFPASMTYAQGAPEVLWRTNAHGAAIGCLSFNKDGSLIASAATAGQPGKIWHVPDAALYLSIDVLRRGEDVVSVDFSPDGNYLIAAGNFASDDCWVRLRLIRVADRTPLWDCAGSGCGISSYLRFSRDGSQLASFWQTDFASPNGYIEFMSAQTQAYLGTFFDFDEFSNRPPFSWSSDSRFFVSVGYSYGNRYPDLLYGMYPRLWNATNFCYIKTLEGHGGSISCLAFSPVGNVLATGGGDRMIRFWNIPEGTTNRGFEAHESGLNYLAFAHDGKLLVSCDGQKMKFWRVSDGALLKVYDQGIQGESAITVSPDGRFFALGGYDGSLTVASMPLWISDVSQSGGEVAIRWYGGSGLYQLQFRTNLLTGNWDNVGGPTTNTLSLNSIAGPSRFYRIQSLPNL